MHKSNVILILASGSGSRFDGIKQLALIEGMPMIERVVRTCLEVTNHVVVVTGAHREQVAAAIDYLGVEIVHNVYWETGMASSITTGVSFIEQHFDRAGHILITLADLPYVRVDDYRALLQVSSQSPGSMVAAKYGRTVGVPAVFPRKAWEALKSLEGDKGARTLLRDNADVVQVEIAAAARDIDTIGDLQ